MIPWAYFVPSGSYRRQLNIVRACPEVAHLVHRQARLDAAAWALLAPWALVIGLPAFALALVALPSQWAAKRLISVRPFDPSDRKNALTDQAHKILPINEVRRRLGLPEVYVGR